MILCDHGPGGAAALFRDAETVVTADTAEALPGAFAALDAARAAGRWVAGYVAYEAGLALEPRLAGLMPAVRPGPLLAMGVFGAPQAADAALAQASAEAAAMTRRSRGCWPISRRATAIR